MSTREYGQHTRTLIQALLKIGVEKDFIVAIVAMANTEEKADKMIDWLVDNQEATDKEILHKAAEMSPELVRKY